MTAVATKKRSAKSGVRKRSIDGQFIREGFRQCRDCERILPHADFYAKTKWPDGSPRTFQSYCKGCQRARLRVYLGVKSRGAPYRARKSEPRTPEQQRERRRERTRERMADPEYRQRKYAYEQARLTDPEKKKRRERQQRKASRAYKHRMNEPYSPKLKKSEWLSPAPFARYVRSAFPTVEAAAAALALDENQLSHMIAPTRSRISLVTVDRALTNYGRPDVLNALYPIGRHYSLRRMNHYPTKKAA